MSLSFGNFASEAASSGTLLVIATSACSRNSSNCSGGVDSCSRHCSGNAGVRMATGSVPRSRNTMREAFMQTALLHVHPAVHMQRDAGDVSSARPGEEGHGGGDIGRLAEAFQRHVFDQFGALFFAQALGHVGVDEAGGDAVHGDVAAADLLREGFGEADHARLGSGVVGLATASKMMS